MTDTPPAEKPKLSRRSKCIRWSVRIVVLLAMAWATNSYLSYVERKQAEYKTSYMKRARETGMAIWLVAYAKTQAKFRSDAQKEGREPVYARPFTVLDDEEFGRQLSATPGRAGARLSRGIEYVYRFQDMDTVGGRAIDARSGFALCATPKPYTSHALTFIIKTDGTVWCKDLGCSQIVKDFPLDPAADGWKVVVRSAPEVAKEPK